MHFEIFHRDKKEDYVIIDISFNMTKEGNGFFRFVVTPEILLKNLTRHVTALDIEDVIDFIVESATLSEIDSELSCCETFETQERVDLKRNTIISELKLRIEKYCEKYKLSLKINGKYIKTTGIH